MNVLIKLIEAKENKRIQKEKEDAKWKILENYVEVFSDQKDKLFAHSLTKDVSNMFQNCRHLSDMTWSELMNDIDREQ